MTSSKKLNVVQDSESRPSDKRREALRRKLIGCADAVVAAHGFEALRARDLAECTGCSIGAIYNLVADLDELVLLVSERTLASLDAALAAAKPAGSDPADQFVAWALAYCDFATKNRNRWRALFEYRLAPGKMFPPWFEAVQMELFVRLETQLADLLPRADKRSLALRARTLFSAVHGIIALGIEEKIAAMPLAALTDEITTFVRTYIAGLKRSSR